MGNFYLAQVPMVTKEFAEAVSAAFPLRDVTTTSTMNEVQRNAGQRDVVKFILKHAREVTITSNEEEIERPREKSVSKFLRSLIGL